MEDNQINGYVSLVDGLPLEMFDVSFSPELDRATVTRRESRQIEVGVPEEYGED